MASSKKKKTAPAREVDEVQAVMQAIVLEESPYAVVQRLSSGTIRRDKLQATDAERQTAKDEELLRKQQRCQATGASIDEGSLTKEPSRNDVAPKKSKPATKPTKSTKSKVARLTIEDVAASDSDSDEA